MSETSLSPTPNGPREGFPLSRARRTVLWMAIGLIIGLFLIGNYCLYRDEVFSCLHRAETFWPQGAIVWALWGVTWAEYDLLAAFAVFGTWNVVVRLPCVFLLATLMWADFLLGSGESVHSVRGIPYLFAKGHAIDLMTVLVPLCAARVILRLRLVREPNASPGPSSAVWQFHLRHIAVATLLISVALATVRMVGSLDAIGLRHQDVIFDIGLIVTYRACHLPITVPGVIGGLALSWRAIPIVLAGLLLCAATTFLEHRYDMSTSIPILLFVQSAFHCFVLVGVLRLYRALGYRLVRVPRRARPAG